MKKRNTKNYTRGAEGAALALCSIMLMTQLAGCNVNANTDNTPSPTVTAAITAAPTATPTAEPTATPEPTKAPYWVPGEVNAIAKNTFSDVDIKKSTKLDYFAIPDEVMQLMTKGDIEMYKRLVPAYFAGEMSIDLPENGEAWPNLLRVVDMYFPIFFYEVDDMSLKTEDGKLSWQYKKGMTDHEKAITEFESAVLGYLSKLKNDDSFIVQVMKLYKEFTANIEYNGDGSVFSGNGVSKIVDEYFELNARIHDEPGQIYIHRHCADALVNGTGVCWCFARAYGFLLSQIGAEAMTVHGFRDPDQAIHEWTVFKYKDKWRYADPTWDKGGLELYYFGFTMNSREFDGYKKNDVYLLEGKTNLAAEHLDVSDELFSPLYTGLCFGDDYKIDAENRRIEFVEYLLSVEKTISYFYLDDGQMKYKD